MKGQIEEIILMPATSKKIINFECHLKDGKKFIAEADARTYQRIQVDKISDQSTNANSVKPKKLKGIGCLIIIILIIGLVIVAIALPAKSEPLSKEEASELDTTAWEQIVNVIHTNNEMMKALTAYTNGNISSVDVYDYCKQSSEYMGQIYNSYPDVKDENAKTYIDTCKNFTIYVLTLADSICDYMNSKSTADLSKVQENINSVNKGVSILTNNRVVFLKSVGYTKEELNVLAEETANQIAQ